MRRGVGVWWWSAIAAADPWGYGDGSDGVLTVTSPATEVNPSAVLAAPTAPGATQLVVDDASGFGLWDLVLVHRTQITTPVALPAPLTDTEWDLAPEVAAAWDLVRIHTILNDEIVVAPALRVAAEAGTQVVRVPEYASVVVQAGASLQASPWSGTEGGIVAFLSLGPVTVDGVVTATGAGSPGGLHVNAPGGNFNCQDPSTNDPSEGGPKGGGLVRHQVDATHGRAEWGNAAGGGNCHNGSGGGGGAFGVGGSGGASHADIQTNRAGGGLRLLFDATAALPFGGGGGAGHANDAAGGDGGAGGGLVWLRAPTVAGTGTVTAAGLDGGAGGADGAGGGGGGGVIAIRSDSVQLSGGVDVRGGDGGSTGDNNIGGGGGGGGGLVYLERPLAELITTELAGGATGTDLDGQPLGATGGGAGATLENPSYDPDSDDDGVTDAEEGPARSDPTDVDTDDDGLTDDVDLEPIDADSDDDCVLDGVDPDVTTEDADGDGVNDSVEMQIVAPVPQGSSGGVWLPFQGTNSPSDCEFDADPTTRTDPTDPDTDGDSTPDGLEDADHDGNVDLGETDPNVADGLLEPHSGLAHSGIPPHSSPATGDGDDDDDDDTPFTTDDDRGKTAADPGCACTSAPFDPIAPALAALAVLGRRSRKRR
jgi:hypothetical protein